MNADDARILVVDDDESLCRSLCGLLRKAGFVPLAALDGRTGLRKLRSESLDVVLLDVLLPDTDGLALLRQIKALDEDLPVVLMTGQAEIPAAVEAMRAHAHDYLAKPVRAAEMLRVVQLALAERRLKLKLQRLTGQVSASQELTEIMGPSDAVGRLITEVNRVASTGFSVVLVGETGSGKEVLARAIHRASPRARGAFVPVDCGAVPETLMEGELFGNERGAFTGAVGCKRGKFELAHGGTLFLDEILNLPMGSQAKLLRAIQEKTIYRLGGTAPHQVDARILVAASTDLWAAVLKEGFREDLFYRLNEFALAIPPLRERRDDILYLAKRFLDLTNVELNKAVRDFSPGAVDQLLRHGWPGNVRELRSAIRRAVLLADGVITEKHLNIGAPGNDASTLNSAAAEEHIPLMERCFPCGSRMKKCGGGECPVGDHLVEVFRPAVSSANDPALPPNWPGPLKDIKAKCLLAVERVVLLGTLTRTKGNKARAARLLEIDYKTMQYKLKEYGITTHTDPSYENQTQPA